ncbi:MAG: (deoxy)nucleoside triphosphate pyrophosphohydrolase [Chlorobiaceae bacterium]|nr:(deoxy)nucleoside triphosphate pyrophosphohydrolase [Chlorobiaceae bacterium]
MHSPVHIGDVVCAIIERQGSFLIAQRPKGKSLACKWEFPGGKVECGESALDALHRELREELGIAVMVSGALTPVFHMYPDFSLRLLPFLCTISAGEPVLHEHRAIAWITLEMIGGYDFPEADLPVLDEYRQRLYATACKGVFPSG